MVGKICKEVDMVWKITLDPQPLDGLLVLRHLLGSVHEDVEQKGTAALPGCTGKHW
jgi:hypothetical protein